MKLLGNKVTVVVNRPLRRTWAFDFLVGILSGWSRVAWRFGCVRHDADGWGR